MKIDISHLVLQGETLNGIINYIRFDLTKDDEIVLHPENPFDFPKYVYNDGFERIIHPDDLAFIDVNIFSIGEYFEIFLTGMCIKHLDNDQNDYYRDILDTVEKSSSYEILIYRGNNPVAFIQVDYNCPQHSYIELR